MVYSRYRVACLSLVLVVAVGTVAPVIAHTEGRGSREARGAGLERDASAAERGPAERGLAPRTKEDRRRTADELRAARRELRDDFRALPPEERRRALRMRDRAGPTRSSEMGKSAETRRRRFDKLPEHVKTRVRERLDALGPEARRRLREGWRKRSRASLAERRAFRAEVRGELGGLTGDRRVRAEERLRQFRALSTPGQDEIRARLRNFESRSAGERRRLLDNAKRFRAMRPEQRARLRRQFDRLSDLSPEERLRLLDEMLPGLGDEER